MPLSTAFIPSSRVSVSLGSALLSPFSSSSYTTAAPKKRARARTSLIPTHPVRTPAPASLPSSSSSGSRQYRCPTRHAGCYRGCTSLHERAVSMSAVNGSGGDDVHPNNTPAPSSASETNATQQTNIDNDVVTAHSNGNPMGISTELDNDQESRLINDNDRNNDSSESKPPALDAIPITLGPLNLNVSPRSLLYIVPFFWGSFAPAVRFLFSQNPHQEVSVFNTERLLLSTLVYSPILWRELQAFQSLYKQSPPSQSHLSQTTQSATSSDSKSPILDSTSSASSSQTATLDIDKTPVDKGSEVLCVEGDKGYSKGNRFDFFTVGLELGIIVFIANIAQVVGLQQTSASRASFLVQLQTVFVPILGTFLGTDRISARTGLSSAVAVGGVFLLSSDKAAGTESSLTGDGLEVLSALFFSYYIVRLSAAANRVAPNPMVATKIAVQAFLSIIWATVTEFLQSRPSAVAATTHAPWTFATVSISIAVVLWTGFCSSAIAGWAQTKGQQAVRPSEAALIFATQPLWATALAAAVLGEKFGNRGIAGGSLIVLATLIPTLADSFLKDNKQQQSKDKER